MMRFRMSSSGRHRDVLAIYRNSTQRHMSLKLGPDLGLTRLDKASLDLSAIP